MLRQATFTAILWLPIAIMAWWAWGYPWWHGPWMTYVTAQTTSETITEGKQVIACISQIEGNKASLSSEACDIEWRYQVNLDCSRTIELWLEDGNGAGETLIWSHRGKSKEAGGKVAPSKLHLPPLAAGRYILEAIATAECTPLYSETIRSPTVAFDVVAKGQ